MSKCHIVGNLMPWLINSILQTHEKESAIVTACIGSFKKIFSSFIGAEELLKLELFSGFQNA